jgi:2,3-bisphosphoglycerate-dependent phosphoglycerate mutase
VPTLHLIRHGETDWNAGGRVQGNTDVPLSERGRAQAEELAARLSDWPIGALYSSDLRRALDTARPLAASLGLEPIVDPILRERSFGVFEGLLDSEVEARLDDSAAFWRDPDTRPDGGESRREVWNRIVGFLDALLEAPPANEIAIVTHGGPIRLAAAYLAREEIESMTWRAVANVSVTTVEI